MRKKLIALLIVVLMVITMVPMTVFADTLETTALTEADGTVELTGYKQFSVTYEFPDGTDIVVRTVMFNGTANPPADPLLPGHDFIGWSMGTDGKNGIITKVKNDITVVAQFKVREYEVSFNSGGGSPAPAKQTVLDGGKATKPTDPDKTGFAFAGWYYNNTLWDFENNNVTQNITLCARWTELNKVTFDSNGGTSVSPQYVADGGKVTKPEDPTKNGYTFSGWYYRQGSQKIDWNFEVNQVNNNITLYARWIEQHTVSFNSMGGSQVDSQTVLDGEKATKPADPDKTGFAFAGWYYYNTLWDFENNMVTQNITLCARWIELNKVTFDSNGGTSVAPQYMADGGKVTKPTDPTKNGYAFSGWYYKQGGQKIDWNFEVNQVNDNLTLYARWIEQHTVSFNSMGGSQVDSQTVLDGGKATKPTDPTRAGFVFDGWYYYYTQWNFDTSTVSHDIVLCAKWIEQHTVTFDSRGGSSVDSQTVLDGENAAKPDDPSKEGYVFDCWLYKKGHNEFRQWNFEQHTVTKNMTLYASWIEVHPVVFDTQGGSSVNSQTVLDGGKVTKPADPTKTGYTFGGWYYNHCGQQKEWNFGFYKVYGNLTLIAKWTANDYIITYDKNGGDGGITADSSHKYGIESNLTTNGYYKAGHDFAGWAKREDASAAEYADGVGVLNLTDENGGSVPLYAVWDIIQFDVTFYEQDGTTVISQQKINWNAAAQMVDAPSITGYAFDKWILKGYDDTESTSLVHVKEKIDAVASYIKNGYTVTFLDYNGTVLGTDGVLYGEGATAPEEMPAREGYTFVGWDKAFNKVTGNLTVTAQYEINTYTVKFVDFDGRELKSQSVNWNASATAPANPAFTGFTFTGWDKAFDKVTSDLTVTAQYAINKYTVKFVDYDGKELSVQSVNWNTAATAPASPTFAGYTFTGWDKAFDKVTADLTVTAQYTINRYTVKFVDHDGKELSVQSVNWSTAAIAPANPTRTGYTFTGWDKAFNSITSDLTVTALYKQNAIIDDEGVPKTYDDTQAFPWWWIVAAAGLIGAIVWIIVSQMKKHKHSGDAV